MKISNSKGEGALVNLIFLAVLAGLGYAVYHFWISSDKKAETPGVAPTPTATYSPGGRKAGSMAGAAVQGAEAMGELSGGH